MVVSLYYCMLVILLVCTIDRLNARVWSELKAVGLNLLLRIARVLPASAPSLFRKLSYRPQYVPQKCAEL